MEASGLDLSILELKALHALGQLFGQTDYEGNRPGHEKVSEAFKWRGVLPVVAFTRSQFFEAYGLDSKLYYSHHAEEALDALRTLLTNRRRLCYTRTVWSGEGRDRKKTREAVVYEGSLATIVETYRDLTKEEQEALHRGETVHRRSTGVEVILGAIFVDGLENFYVLKPASGYREIEAVLRPARRRISRAHYLFLDWLLTWSKNEVTISTDNLLERLRLDAYLHQRKRNKAEAILEQVLATAKEAGYLLSYEEQKGQLGQKVLHLTLNPEKLGRPLQVRDTAEASDG